MRTLWRSSGKKTKHNQRPTVRPRLEALEDRLVPSGSQLLDLTARGSAGTVEGALFQQGDPGAGTGQLHTFLRLHSPFWKQIEQGVNTDARPLQFDELRDRHSTHALKLSDVRQVTVGGKKYREFVLDAHENRWGALLSLDQLQLYVSSRADVRGYNAQTHKLGGLAPVFDLDAHGDHWVKLDTRLNRANGKADLVVLVPESVFAGAGAKSFVYLYSRFGDHYGVNGGAEAWKTRHGPAQPPPPPPSPTTGSISGTVFQDTNRSGVQDPSEVGVTGGVVWLDTNGNGMIDTGEATANIDTFGHYTFGGLTLGQSYRVRLQLDFDWEGTSTNPLLVSLTTAAPNVAGINFGEVFLDMQQS